MWEMEPKQRPYFYPLGAVSLMVSKVIEKGGFSAVEFSTQSPALMVLRDN